MAHRVTAHVRFVDDGVFLLDARLRPDRRRVLDDHRFRRPGSGVEFAAGDWRQLSATAAIETRPRSVHAGVVAVDLLQLRRRKPRLRIARIAADFVVEFQFFEQPEHELANAVRCAVAKRLAERII